MCQDLQSKAIIVSSEITCFLIAKKKRPNKSSKEAGEPNCFNPNICMGTLEKKLNWKHEQSHKKIKIQSSNKTSATKTPFQQKHNDVTVNGWRGSPFEREELMTRWATGVTL